MTYEGFAAAWPDRGGKLLADKINSVHPSRSTASSRSARISVARRYLLRGV
jgi:hypothetical protein